MSKPCLLASGYGVMEGGREWEIERGREGGVMFFASLV